MGALQTTFSVRLNVAGRFFSAVDPLKFGPRHCAQCSLCTAAGSDMQMTMISAGRRRSWLRFGRFMMILTQCVQLNGFACNRALDATQGRSIESFLAIRFLPGKGD